MSRIYPLLIIILIGIFACSSTTKTPTVKHQTLNIDKDTTIKGSTRNYKFHLRSSTSNKGICKRLDIRVDNVPKLYTTSGRKSPMRLKIVDDTCLRPFVVNKIRVRYQGKGIVRIGSPRGIAKFKSHNERIFYELDNFLHQEGII